jgi:hypothetical protein
VLDVTRTVAVARDLGALLDAVFVQAGFGDYTNDGVADAIGIAVIVVNVAGLAVAIGLAVPRLRAHRTAFWVPLTIGIGCVLLTTALILGAAVGDPAFAAQISR